MVHDRDDPQVPWQHGERYRQAWEGSRFLMTERLGHQRILSSDTVVDKVVEFLVED